MNDVELPVVVALDEQADVHLDIERWRVLARAALRSCGITGGELNLIFVDDEAMAELNKDHMGADGPTDVLSFPLDGADSEGPGEALIGDVVVCPAYASRQAEAHRDGDEHDGSLEDELALLVVHGVLHVLGHDHGEPDETRLMRARERELLAAHHRG